MNNIKYDKKCIIMVGNIGSGKSTYVKDLHGEYAVVSRDKLRYMFGNGNYIFDTKLEPTVSAATFYIVDNLMETGVNIIVDETNVNIKMRKMYIGYAKMYGYEISAIVLPRLSMEESVNRRMNDPHGQYDRTVWENVWKKFDNSYIEPTLQEGFNSVHIILNN